MKLKKFVLAATVGITAVTISSVAYSQVGFLKSVKKQQLIAQGKQAYDNRCSGCHGLEGNGQGPAAQFLDPKPRDFTKAIFKFKSTPIGSMPTDDDIMRILNQGIPGSSMPEFRLVSTDEKQAIVAYIKTFNKDAWKNQSHEDVVPHLKLPKGVFTKKDEFLKYARRGRVWYQELGCLSCHGASGEGNGPSATTLKDSWGDDIRPANLKKDHIKRGWTVQDVAYSIMMGVDGTPMPAHIDILDSLADQFPEVREKQYLWELASYVFYLRGVGAGLYEDELPAIPESGIPADEVQAQVGKYLQ
ncbi:MAG: c-type cytochrome [Deltaproteobacteria bacterium]|nr:c-type cytochrome [Deltaproteobacteria bacterium]